MVLDGSSDISRVKEYIQESMRNKYNDVRWVNFDGIQELIKSNLISEKDSRQLQRIVESI